MQMEDGKVSSNLEAHQELSLNHALSLYYTFQVIKAHTLSSQAAL